MKPCLLVIFFSACISLIQAQSSSIYLQNNTELDFQITAVQSGTHTMDANEWDLKATDMYPWEMQKEILNTNRNNGIHNGETFYFDVYVWHGTDTFVMQLRLEGNFIGSDMDHSLKGPGFDHSWHNGGGFHEESFTFNGLPVTIKYKPDGSDALFNRDLVFAIHHNKPLYTIDSADYSNPNVINVLSYNVQMLPFGITGMGNADKRGDFVPRELSPYQDVVIFQEVFDDSPRNNDLIPAMTAAGFTHRTDILNDNQAPTWNGGVMIFSRWPIEFEDEYDYRNCDNNAADCLAAKGIMYARINKLGKKYHVFGTHVEAGGNANDIAIKKEQFGEQRDFIIAQNIPPTEAVIIGGDMNTDASSVQYPNMVDSLNPVIGPHLGFFASTAVDRDSGNIIDHVWSGRDHLIPVDCHTKIWVFRTIHDDLWEIFDPSDHLPVNGRFEYPEVDTPTVSNDEICGNSPFAINATGHPYQSYQWYLNGNPIAGATNANYTNPAPTIADTGVYSCQITTQFTVEDTSALGHPNWPDTATQIFNYTIANVTYNSIDMNPTISQQGDTLFSSAATGNQWYDATGAIVGATDSFYVVSQAGAYYVVVNQGSCTSNNSNVINWTSIQTLANQGYFKLYPNPTRHRLNIEAPQQDFSIEILDATGRSVYQQHTSNKQLQIDLQSLSSGMYLVKLVNETGVFVEQLIKD